jgi:hypothetical protein
MVNGPVVGIIPSYQRRFTMGKKYFDVHFGLGSADGLRSSIWRAWAPNKADSVYCAPLSGSASMKASFHGNEHWQVAFNAEFYKKMRGAGIAMGPTRKLDQWVPEQNLPIGFTIALRIFIPASELRVVGAPPTNAPIKWLPLPADGQLGQIVVLFDNTDEVVEGWPGQRSMDSILVQCAELKFGRLWIVYTVQPMDVGMSQRLQQSLESTRSARKVQFHPFPPGDTSSLRVLAGGENSDGSRYFFDLAADHPEFGVVSGS